MPCKALSIFWNKTCPVKPRKKTQNMTLFHSGFADHVASRTLIQVGLSEVSIISVTHHSSTYSVQLGAKWPCPAEPCFGSPGGVEYHRCLQGSVCWELQGATWLKGEHRRTHCSHDSVCHIHTHAHTYTYIYLISSKIHITENVHLFPRLFSSLVYRLLNHSRTQNSQKGS